MANIRTKERPDLFGELDYLLRGVDFLTGFKYLNLKWQWYIKKSRSFGSSKNGGYRTIRHAHFLLWLSRYLLN